MSNSMKNLDKELRRKLTSSEFNAADRYLEDAIFWANKSLEAKSSADEAVTDKRVRDSLTCAIAELNRKGEYHAVKVCDYYKRFF